MSDTQPSEKELTVVIPIYNEAQSLPHLLPELVNTCRAQNWDLILVNDGSQDETALILEQFANDAHVKVLHHKVNRGYGGALKTGLLSAHTRYVVTMDSDGQHTLSDLDAIYQFAVKTDADMVVGSRVEKEHINLYRELGKWIIRSFTRILVPLRVKDLNSGFKLYRTSLVKRYLHLCPDSMAFSDVITLLFLNQGHLVLEIPITVRKRIGGTSSISTRTAFETIIEILGLVMLVNPLRIFLPLSLFCISVGLLWGVPIVIAGRGVSVGAMLAIVLGTLFFFLGLIASQLAAIRLRLANLHDEHDRE
ncbi:glycosyltransferase family 2 protein [Anaerolinea sp.]|uniref:glycosyltransferase family 2 protein n=1 Tax=Anaerolinea sp. TaxID=1872519 RepID=UPI002ACE3A05|nr:glycosyltransferase family 2 protein [Anaerolinea sp.]